MPRLETSSQVRGGIGGLDVDLGLDPLTSSLTRVDGGRKTPGVTQEELRHRTTREMRQG